MKIDVLCRDGSPLGVTEATLRGETGRPGVGGSELALLTMCSAWKFYGHDVTLYNDPNPPGASSFPQRTLGEFNPAEDRDILIIFRSPNPQAEISKGKKIWWSCDSHTIDDYRAFRSKVDKVVCISKHHAEYFKFHYGIEDAIAIDLPVRTWEYKKKPVKIPKQCIFTSMPDRGALQLAQVWPRIHKEVPSATLVLTSDWRLWVDWAHEGMLQQYKKAFVHHPNINYMGAVKRDQLIKIQEHGEVHLYPCIFEEQFCISVAESQVAGAFPITSGMGALPTTNMGRVLVGDPTKPHWQDTFVQNAVELLTDPKLDQKQEWVREVARKRFSVERILSQWDEKVFEL